MLSDVQKSEIINIALIAFQKQYGVLRDVSDMNLSIDKPNVNAYCSFFIASNGDDFRIKLNLVAMENTTSITAYRDSQLQGYGPGLDDEVVVANLTLDKRDYSVFYRYLNSQEFKDSVIDNRNMIIDEDEVAVTSEEGITLTFEDKGV